MNNKQVDKQIYLKEQLYTHHLHGKLSGAIYTGRSGGAIRKWMKKHQLIFLEMVYGIFEALQAMTNTGQKKLNSWKI